MSAQTAPRVAPSTPHVAEASCLARESAAAAAAGKATNSVDTKECGHHFYPASSSVVRSAKPAANVVKGSRRQRKQAESSCRASEAASAALRREEQAHVEAMSKLRKELARAPTFCTCVKGSKAKAKNQWILDNVRIDANGYRFCRCCRHIFVSGDERKGHLVDWSGMVFEAMKDVARRAEFDSTSDDDGAALAASGTFRKGRDIDECSEDGTPTEAEILEALACEYDDFEDW